MLRQAVVACLLLPACVPKTRPAATAVTVGGAALAIAGGLVLADLTRDDHDPSSIEGVVEDIECAALCPIAIGVMILGVEAMIVGLIGISQTEASAPPPAAPGLETISARDARLVLPLPVMRVDAETLHLAQQARNLARDGHCDGALDVIDRIAARDAAYASALRTSPALAPCVPPG